MSVVEATPRVVRYVKEVFSDLGDDHIIVLPTIQVAVVLFSSRRGSSSRRRSSSSSSSSSKLQLFNQSK